MNLLGPAFTLYLKAAVDPWLRRTAADAGRVQRRLLARLLGRARDTWFGRRHSFASLRSHEDFAKAVPVADYAARQDVFDRILHKEADVCWPGRVRLFARTTGTVAGSKYIPVTPGTRWNQMRAGLAMMAFAARADPGLVSRLFAGQFMMLGGRDLRPTETGAMERAIGDVASRWVPWPFRRHMEPGRLNAIEDFEEKIDRIARHLVGRDLRLLGHMPTWSMVLFDRVCRVAGVDRDGGISRVWPNLELMIYGGMNLAPYRAAFLRYFRPDHRLWFQEVYPSTEGFMAAQSDLREPGMEMLVDNEIVFEFVPLEEWGKPGAARLLVDEVKPDGLYGLVLSTSAGLWAYDLGDIVRVVSVRPLRVLFAGRHGHFMNAFGEHIIGEEVSRAVGSACDATAARVAEFTAAPRYPDLERTSHAIQFAVEFEQPPQGGLDAFAREVDRTLKALNHNYESKRGGDLRIVAPDVVAVPRGTFYEWMKRRGRLGGQNKVPVCANDRRYMDDLLAMAAERGGGPVAVGAAAPEGGR